MRFEINDRVLAFAHYNGKPLWLCGTIRQVMKEVGHVGIFLRKDYQIDGNKYIVVPKEFVFKNIEEADAWQQSIDKSLTSFTVGHDSSEESWEAPALSWESMASQSAEQDETQCASDSEPSSTHPMIVQDELLSRLNAQTTQTSAPS